MAKYMKFHGAYQCILMEMRSSVWSHLESSSMDHGGGRFVRYRIVNIKILIICKRIIIKIVLKKLFKKKKIKKFLFVDYNLHP